MDAWISKGVQVSNSAALLKYRTVEADGKANINLRSGTVRFWFKPLWNSGTGTGAAANLIEVGSRGDGQTNGWWSLFLNESRDVMNFVSQTNDTAEVTNLTAGVSFTSNRWCQIVLTYTNEAVALYTNGVLCAASSASLPYPPLATRADGFAIGCDASTNGEQAKAVFEDLETFNYPLCADDIQIDFEMTQPPNLIPDLRMWLRADVDARTNAPSNKVDPWLDQSGNSNNATQGSPANQPFLVQSGIGDKPSIYFPGTNYFMLPNNLFSNAMEAEVFIVLAAETNRPTQGQGLWALGVTANSYYPNPA